MATNSYSINNGQGRRTERWDKKKDNREGALAYNERMKNEYMARQSADVAAFKARQQKVIDDKRANEQATKLAKINQEGQTTRTGMTTDLGRERLGFDKESSLRDYGLKADNQDYTQSMDLMDYSRQGKYADRSFDFDKEKFKYLQNLDDRKLTEEEKKNKFNEYRILAGLGKDSNGLGLGSTLESFVNNVNQYQAYTGSDQANQTSPNFGTSSTWQPEEIDFINQNYQAPQSTGLASVGNNSYTMTQQYTKNRPDNPHYQPPQTQDRLAPLKSIAAGATNALRPVGDWLTKGVLNRQNAANPIRESVGSFGERRFSNY